MKPVGEPSSVRVEHCQNCQRAVPGVIPSESGLDMTVIDKKLGLVAKSTIAKELKFTFQERKCSAGQPCRQPCPPRICSRRKLGLSPEREEGDIDEETFEDIEAKDVEGRWKQLSGDQG